jgi:hypothetical protein
MVSMRRYRQLASKSKAAKAVSGPPEAVSLSDEATNAKLTQAHWRTGLGRIRQVDILLLGRAVKEQWPLTEEQRADVIAELHSTATNDPKGLTRVAACRALIAADALNAAREKAAADAGRPQVTNIFDRVQILMQQLAPACPQIAQDAAPSHDLLANEQASGEQADGPQTPS